MKTRAKSIWLFPEIPAWQGDERKVKQMKGRVCGVVASPYASFGSIDVCVVLCARAGVWVLR